VVDVRTGWIRSFHYLQVKPRRTTTVERSQMDGFHILTPDMFCYSVCARYGDFLPLLTTSSCVDNGTSKMFVVDYFSAQCVND